LPDRYVSQFVFTLAQTSPGQFREIHERLSLLPGEVRLVWNDGPRIQSLYRQLEKNGLQPVRMAKGVLLDAYGLSLEASGRRHRRARLRHCELQPRAARPALLSGADPNLNFEFCKGYTLACPTDAWARHAPVITPLIRALESLFGFLPFLRYLDSFRYPLSGEFAMQADWRASIASPQTGMEIGVLAEITGIAPRSAVCQVDIADNYEHKHQELSPGDPSKGLMKMALDIAKTLFRVLSAAGVCIFPGLERTLPRTARGTVSCDVERHLHETFRRVARREFLVLVLVVVGDVHLADALSWSNSCKSPQGRQSPIPSLRDAIDARQVRLHGELAGER